MKEKKSKRSMATDEARLVSSLQRMIEMCDRAIARAGELEKNPKTRDAGVVLGKYWRGKREFYKDRLYEAKAIVPDISGTEVGDWNGLAGMGL